jgi:D-alanyl-lipoteichoic acid acyltransferase DltB (MBOAT superfamily)
MLFSSVWDFTAARLIDRSTSASRRRLVLAASIGANITLLGFFKYAGFFAENLQAIASLIGWRLSPFYLHIVLPVGISFYTFQSIGYVIDVYRRHVEPCRSLLDYFTFVAFFPQLMAGPIERAPHLLGQFQRPRTFDATAAADGCRQILWGLFKKLAIADRLSPLVDASYGDPAAHSGGQLALATVFFAFQIYCDFSAYSDIAIGTARLLGIDLMRNFAYPYFSQSVGEFWRRWHISLSTWFRDYLYVPLGGSRVPPLRRWLNVVTTFTVSGFWHGAAWQYVVWGLINGVALTPQTLRPPPAKTKARPTNVPGGERLLPSPVVMLKIAGTFTLICVTWVFFRSASIHTAFEILRKIAAAPFARTDATSATWANRAEAVRMSVVVLGFVAVEWCQRRHAHPLTIVRLPRPLRWMTYTALLWLTFNFATEQTSAFIYFQF